MPYLLFTYFLSRSRFSIIVSAVLFMKSIIVVRRGILVGISTAHSLAKNRVVFLGLTTSAMPIAMKIPE